ncbi:hypothetical protein HGRIS_001711 [Hohenbuehelia grisea]|uniref:Uncharacterized protein n=1 Tax=Hohenbuehelia grisea TaxID=104357 RepID=A0ABR3JJ24_9AGAR
MSRAGLSDDALVNVQPFILRHLKVLTYGPDVPFLEFITYPPTTSIQYLIDTPSISLHRTLHEQGELGATTFMELVQCFSPDPSISRLALCIVADSYSTRFQLAEEYPARGTPHRNSNIRIMRRAGRADDGLTDAVFHRLLARMGTSFYDKITILDLRHRSLSRGGERNIGTSLLWWTSLVILDNIIELYTNDVYFATSVNQLARNNASNIPFPASTNSPYAPTPPGR